MGYYSAIKRNAFESVLMRWIRSIQFSRSDVSDSFQPQEQQLQANHQAIPGWGLPQALLKHLPLYKVTAQ